MSPDLKLILSSPQVAPPALRTVGLGSVFPMEGMDLPVLHDVNFDVAPGELVCILGPSGCGKTTLLNIIAGFQPPSSGAVLVAGRPITRPGQDRCVVFQEDALFPWLTVAENIAFGLKGRMSAKARSAEVERFLGMIGLERFRNYLPRQLSGGMKQRVALARVLILQPQLLLMDEPFGALDAQTREEMQSLLLALWRQLSHTILFVTHDIWEAITLADRIVLMGKHRKSIRRIIKVPLKRPRRNESDDFHNFYRRLRNAINSE